MQAQVSLSVATRSFDIFYSYRIPDELCSKMSVGSFVKVPFGRNNRLVDGLVFLITEFEEGNSAIKEIHSLSKKNPLSKIQLELVQWMKEEYICTIFDAVRCVVPSYTTESSKNLRMIRLGRPSEEIELELSNNQITNLAYLNVLEILLESGELLLSQVLIQANVSVSVVNTLIKKGYLTSYLTQYSPTESKPLGLSVKQTVPHVLNEEQQIAFSAIQESMNTFTEFLLFGITGSGKTEIYLKIIEENISLGRSSIVLVPEISLTPLMIGRFEARFHGQTAIIHSRMTPAEKRKSWRRIESGKAKVIIGARSAIFAPVKDLGVVIVDEEHEHTYKSEVKPKYDARDVGKFICRANNCPIIYASATPSIEMYYRAEQNELTLLKLKNRTNLQGLPSVSIVDMREELSEGNKSIFSRELSAELQNNIRNGFQSLLFLNRRGYASFVICRDCGYVVKCSECSISMTYHKNSNKLICHYCGNLETVPQVCPSCHSNKIRHFGSGTQKIEEELQNLYPGLKTIRMDLDTVTGKGSHRDILNKFDTEKIPVMIGTQMITKGHDFENITLVGVLAADSSLYSPDFRSSERTFQQITQVSGRAGRGGHKGKVVIQTYNIDHPAIQAAAAQNFNRFYSEEIQIRKNLNYPPFYYIGYMLFSSPSKQSAHQMVKIMHVKILQYLSENQESVSEVIAPQEAASLRLRGRYRLKIIIKNEDKELLRKILAFAYDAFYSKKVNDVDLSVDINPYNMI